MLYSHPLRAREFEIWESSWDEPPVPIRLLGIIVDATAEHAFLAAHREFWANASRMLVIEHIEFCNGK